jgi:hypothetical protein
VSHGDATTHVLRSRTAVALYQTQHSVCAPAITIAVCRPFRRVHTSIEQTSRVIKNAAPQAEPPASSVTPSTPTQAEVGRGRSQRRQTRACSCEVGVHARKMAMIGPSSIT